MSTNAVTTSNANPPVIRSGSLARGLTLRRVYDNLTKPFSLSSRAHTPSFARVPTRIPVSSSPSQHTKDYSVDPESPPTFLSRAMKSDVPESNSDSLISLPFRLDIQMARNKIERNIPYLRQSWGRVDFVAVVGFWVSFVLATLGLERGTYHIGTFRALSVLRTARLLSITNGTAVSDILLLILSCIFLMLGIRRSCARLRLSALCWQTWYILLFLLWCCSREFSFV